MIPQRTIGRGGPKVSAIGLGCMGMSGGYGSSDEREAIETIHRALELGVNLIDTADSYAQGLNEQLVGRALADRREQAFLASKFGRGIGDAAEHRKVYGHPDYVRSACEASLRRLGVETIDLYYQHRVDPSVPIEETVGAMSDLVAAGKVRFLGLSEATADQIRRANGVHRISALESEFSLFTRTVEDNGILDTLRELEISLVPYSPLGRGLLTGGVRSPEDLAPDDMRRHHPRFAEENLAKNIAVVDALQHIAADAGLTATQLALGWVLAQGDDIIPIPGTKRVARIEENAAGAASPLSPEVLARIAEVAPKGIASGRRDSPNSMIQT